MTIDIKKARLLLADAAKDSFNNRLLIAFAVNNLPELLDAYEEIERYKQALADAIETAASDAPYRGRYLDQAWERANRILNPEPEGGEQR